MVENFNDVFSLVKKKKKRKIAIAAANDEQVLDAIIDAIGEGIADTILVGPKCDILNIAEDMHINISGIEVINEPDSFKAAQIAVYLVREGKADMLMKGNIQTSQFLKAVLDKDAGLRPKTEKKLSHVSVFDVPALRRMLILTDAAVNIAPDIADKVQIIENAVKVAKAIGIETPKVAVISATEMVNPNMQSTIDAALLSKMGDRGQIKGCIIDGPLAFDNAISKDAMDHKNIKSPVEGEADIIVVPNIETGNALYKALVYTANAKVGGVLVGASSPVILTSRADSTEAKLNSIALASLC